MAVRSSVCCSNSAPGLKVALQPAASLWLAVPLLHHSQLLPIPAFSEALDGLTEEDDEMASCFLTEKHHWEHVLGDGRAGRSFIKVRAPQRVRWRGLLHPCLHQHHTMSDSCDPDVPSIGSPQCPRGGPTTQSKRGRCEELETMLEVYSQMAEYMVDQVRTHSPLCLLCPSAWCRIATGSGVSTDAPRCADLMSRAGRAAGGANQGHRGACDARSGHSTKSNPRGGDAYHAALHSLRARGFRGRDFWHELTGSAHLLNRLGPPWAALYQARCASNRQGK